MKNNKKQQGFTLITVMILSSIAGVIVLSSLKDNTNQERLSGNFQKSLNARLVAEQGVYDAFAQANTFLANNPGATQADIIAGVGIVAGDGDLAGTNYNAQFVDDGNGQLSILSTGNRFESQAFLTANVNLTLGAVNGPFQNAIVGCEGVNLAGSGEVNSYNSNDGEFNELNTVRSNEGDVKTISDGINGAGVDINLSGGSNVSGDVSSTGNINVNSAEVNGNVHANGNVDIGTNGSGGVLGNIIAGGNSTQGNSSFVGGNITVDRNVSLGDGAAVAGNVIAGGNFAQRSSGNNFYNGIERNQGVGGTVVVSGNANLTFGSLIDTNNTSDVDIQFGGLGDFVEEGSQNEYRSEGYAGNLNELILANVESVITDNPLADGFDANNPDTNCDYLNITAEIDNVANELNELNELMSLNSNGANVNLIIDPAGIQGNDNFVAVSTSFLGQNINVITLDSVSFTSGGTINITGGDVTLFVENNFTLQGATQIVIADGSSLTLIANGQIALGNGANIIANNEGVTESSGLPAVSIYSSFTGNGNGNNAGISISGSLSTYAAIYAPLTNVAVLGSGDLLGSVRAKEVSITGAGDVLYDTSLRDFGLGGGNGGGGTTLSLTRFEY